MKLYIPTSSLNFNNILSTESVSPKTFYDKRGFGYPRWDSINENNIPNVTLLYEKPYKFARPESDIEDHPLLIEYSTDKDYPICGDGVHYTSETIYFNPWNTRLIFLSEEDMQVTLSHSESSLETKMLNLYKNHIIVNNEFEEGLYPIVDASKIGVVDSENAIECDRKVNKFKGFLYGYYIGAYLSIKNIEGLSQINILREILNILSSALSGVEKTPSASQWDRLGDLVKTLYELNSTFQSVVSLSKDGDAAYAHEIFDKLSSRGLLNENLFPFNLNALLKNNLEETFTFVNKELTKQIKITEEARTPLLVEKGEIAVEENKLTTVSDDIIGEPSLLTIYTAWINDVLSTNEFNGKVNPQKEKLSDSLTIKAKEVLGEDKWQVSPINMFMNQLRKHLRGEEFNQSWGNNVLSAIASCLIKGDEWDKLFLFMQNKGMTDYRLAFSFYGILNGFANLTRDFTDLLLNLDRKYVADVYKEFARQLLGETIKKQVKEPSMEKVPVESNTEKGQDAFFTEMVKKSFDSPKFKFTGNKEKLREGLDAALAEFANNKNVFAFWTTLRKENGWGTKTIAKLKNILDSSMGKSNDCTNITKSIDLAATPGDLFSEENIRNNNPPIDVVDRPTVSTTLNTEHNLTPLFIEDAKAKDFILSRDYLSEKMKQTLAKELYTLQKRYEPGGKYSKKPKGNKSTINSFKDWCLYDYLGPDSSAVKNTTENKELLERLTQDLLAHYGNR